MVLIGLLVSVQSVCLYAAVARMPVGLALLVFNSYPIWATLAARVLYGRKPERATLIAMPVILIGLALALNVVRLSARPMHARNGRPAGRALASRSVPA